MSKKSISSVVFTALFITISFVFSACSKASAVTPVSHIEKKFKNSYDMHILKSAIETAALKKSWEILNTTSESISLKRSYTIKVRDHKETKVKRHQRVSVEKELYLNIVFNENSLKITIADQSRESFKSDFDKEQLNTFIDTLKAAIYTELLGEII